jgi:hypothetical protein
MTQPIISPIGQGRAYEGAYRSNEVSGLSAVGKLRSSVS